jgi:hypothetical protein
LVDSGRNVGAVFSGAKHVVADIDTDGDGIVDPQDTDDDNDGVLDVDDACPLGGANLNGLSCTGVPITGNNAITVEGRVWAQPDLFAYLSWNDINAVCPDGACAIGGMLNGHDMTGWTWADVDEVNSLFNFYIGRGALGPGSDHYEELDSEWAPEFFSSGWRASGAYSPYHSTSGWLRTVGLSEDGVSPAPLGAELFDCLQGDCVLDAVYGPSLSPGDNVRTGLYQPNDFNNKDWFLGGWFFRSP